MRTFWKKYFSIFILYTLIFLSHAKVIAEERFGYLVTGQMTLIQIARDVYGDERLWNRIAYVNNIKSPYVLSVGQKLILPFEPRKKLKAKNRLLLSEIPAPKELTKNSIPTRNIVENKDEIIYIVGERAPTLTMVAIENFGQRNKVSTIARWNNLRPDAKLSLGQKLVFKQKPTLSQEESDQILSQYWNKLGNSFMGRRIANNTVANPNAKPAVSSGPSPLPVRHPAESKSKSIPPTTGVSQSQVNDNNVTDVEPIDMGPAPAPAVVAPVQQAAVIPPAPAPAVAAPVQQAAVIPPAPAPAVAAPVQQAAVIPPAPAPAEVAPVQQAAVIPPAPMPAVIPTAPQAADVDPELAEISRQPAATTEQVGEPTSDVYWLGDSHIYQINKISGEQKKQ
jgi:hypothetical protein